MPEFADNHVLAGLPPSDYHAVGQHLERVSLTAGSVLLEAGESPEFVFFPTRGVLSLVGTTGTGLTVAVAIVGREGLAPVSAVLASSQMPFRVIAKLDTDAWRARTDCIASRIRDCTELHDRVLDYSQTLIIQLAQSAVCNRFHNARQRLARWLLMIADRTEERELPLTHEFISFMVGGPRSAMSEAAGALRDAGAIDYRRARVLILNRARLLEQACECYAVVRAASTPLLESRSRA